jgi:TPR repeat protein
METSTMRHLRLAAESGDAAAQFNLGVLLTAVRTTMGMPSKATERRRSNGCWQLLSRACRALRAGSPNSMRAARTHQETW